MDDNGTGGVPPQGSPKKRLSKKKAGKDADSDGDIDMTDARADVPVATKDHVLDSTSKGTKTKAQAKKADKASPPKRLSETFVHDTPSPEPDLGGDDSSASVDGVENSSEMEIDNDSEVQPSKARVSTPVADIASSDETRSAAEDAPATSPGGDDSPMEDTASSQGSLTPSEGETTPSSCTSTQETTDEEEAAPSQLKSAVPKSARSEEKVVDTQEEADLSETPTSQAITSSTASTAGPSQIADAEMPDADAAQPFSVTPADADDEPNCFDKDAPPIDTQKMCGTEHGLNMGDSILTKTKDATAADAESKNAKILDKFAKKHGLDTQNTFRAHEDEIDSSSESDEEDDADAEDDASVASSGVDDTPEDGMFVPEDDCANDDSSDSEPPVTKKKPQRAPKKPRQPKLRGVTKKRGPAKKSTVDLQKLIHSNLLAEIEDAGDSSAVPTFQAGNNKAAAFKALQEQAKNLIGDEKKEYNKGMKLVKDASSSLGAPLVKPADNGQWSIPKMRSTLQNHQLIALAWMVRQENNLDPPHGGILADSMGLGKTLMTLALIVRGKDHVPRGPTDIHPSEYLVPADTTLIVAPAGLLDQWFSEIRKHCDTHRKSERGSKKDGITRFRKYKPNCDMTIEDEVADLVAKDVVITSYETVLGSYPNMEWPGELTDPFEREVWFEQHYERCKGTLHCIRFKRIIMDESHVIRNPTSKKFKACRALRSNFKWCLTGTPAVNGMGDMWAPLDLIGVPNIETQNRFIDRYVNHRTDSTDAALRDILGRCMMRRKHDDKLFNVRIVPLPKTTHQSLGVNFNAVEQQIYDIVVERFIQRLNDMSRSRISGERMARSGLTMLLRLRQLTAHPLLIQSTLLELLEEEDYEKLNDVFKHYESQNTENGKQLILQLRKSLQYLKDRKAIAPDEELDAQGIEVISNPDVVSVSGTFVGGVGGKWGHKAQYGRLFKKMKGDRKKIDDALDLKCVCCLQQATEPHITSCKHIYCLTCLEQSQEDAALDGRSGMPCEADGCGQVFSTAVPVGAEHILGKEKGAKLPTGIVDWLSESGQIVPSAKTLAVKVQTMMWLEQHPDDKIIWFTQWRPMIQILANICEHEKWGYVKYHGEMSQTARTEQIEAFSSKPDVKIFIGGLKCGSLGLNLTMSNRVIMIDPWWNNAVEEQALARVYRIGQQKETASLQLLVNHTIDQRLVEIKARKQAEIDNLGKIKLTHRELFGLFGTVTEDRRGNLQVEVP